MPCLESASPSVLRLDFIYLFRFAHDIQLRLCHTTLRHTALKHTTHRYTTLYNCNLHFCAILQLGVEQLPS
jgi:hypothetical protein